MKGQQHVRFPVEVSAFLDGNYQAMLHGNYVGVEEIVMPLFMELDPNTEQQFRDSARSAYVVGTEIEDLYHPVWKDEARRMNAEAGLAEEDEDNAD